MTELFEPNRGWRKVAAKFVVENREKQRWQGKEVEKAMKSLKENLRMLFGEDDKTVMARQQLREKHTIKQEWKLPGAIDRIGISECVRDITLAIDALEQQHYLGIAQIKGSPLLTDEEREWLDIYLAGGDGQENRGPARGWWKEIR